MCILGRFLFQAEDGIRDLVRSRGLGDVYKRQAQNAVATGTALEVDLPRLVELGFGHCWRLGIDILCLLYTSDAADERSSVDLGGRRIIKKKTTITQRRHTLMNLTYYQYKHQ